MKFRRLLLILLGGLAGCESERIGSFQAHPPVIALSKAERNPRNVLSAIVHVAVSGADSVAVRYGLVGEALDGVTPALALPADTAVLPVLGLLPERDYVMQVVAWGSGEVAHGAQHTLRTDSLPADLPSFATLGTDPSPGYVVFSAGRYGLVIDNTGRVVWYYHFDVVPGLNFQAQSNGRYAALPIPEPGTQAAWVEIDPSGTITQTFSCARGLQPRFHDLLTEGDGSRWLLCDETRTVDLSASGGAADARVTGTVIQHVSASGASLFEWSVFDHFDLADLSAAELAQPNINWTHGNALDLDGDGNLLVSFRNLSEVTRIEVATGAVLWRMGGIRNQFTFEGAEEPAFARQHGVRATAPGKLLLLDNLGDPASSRAEAYEYDVATHTARRTASYRALPAVIAQLGGTAQQLANGRVLVSFGSGAYVAEYEATGEEVWRLVQPGYVFRAQRISSLYAPGLGTPR